MFLQILSIKQEHIGTGKSKVATLIHFIYAHILIEFFCFIQKIL